MRGIARLRSFSSFVAVAVGFWLVCVAGAARAQDAKATGPLRAVLQAVNPTTGAINKDQSRGNATFTSSGDHVQVVVSVNGLSVAGSEEGADADGTGNSYPRVVEIFSGTCEAAVKSGTSGAERLPDIELRSDGSGNLEATTKTPMAKLVGQTVVIIHPRKPGGEAGTGKINACGVIRGK
ncbi:MAG TPA: hypothetical protein VFD92_12490 [Candidatus Binatia bacterium]|nr:hypothetical protein [Candidatus Binatia bacterium]